MSSIAWYEPKADEMVITVHRWFANKSCPGNWLYERLGDLAAKVTANLGTKPVEPADPKPTEPVPADTFKVGDKVKMTAGAPVYGKTYKFQSWVYDRELFVRAVSGSKITVSIYASGDITGNVDKKYPDALKPVEKLCGISKNVFPDFCRRLYHVPKNFEKCSDYRCGIYCGILDTLCSIFRTFSQI